MKVPDLGFRVQGLGVWGPEFGVLLLGFRVQGLGFRVSKYRFQVKAIPVCGCICIYIYTYVCIYIYIYLCVFFML